FAPAGTRGANPFVRAARFRSGPEWFGQANEECAVLVMIEGKEGVAAVPDILGIAGLDGVFVGPVDLSHALGVPGETDHPIVVDKVRETVEAASRAGVATAVFAPEPAAAARWFSAGVRVVALGVDTALALGGFETAA